MASVYNRTRCWITRPDLNEAWVFLVLSNEFYVTGEAEELHGLEPALIHLFRDDQHRIRPHPQSPEA